MHQEAKKGMLYTLGALGLVVLGALAAVMIVKMTSASPASVATAPAATVTAAAEPAPAATTAAPAPVAPTVAAAPAPVAAAPAPVTSGMAQVTSVQPHFSVHSYPVRVCHDEPRTTLVGPPPGAHAGTSGIGAVVGGLAGGALGNQVGQGRGRTAATIGGVVLGALAGNGVEGNMNQPPPPQEETVIVPVCHTKFLQRSVVNGYDVSYMYNGQPGSTRMKYAPAVGSTIPLSLQPG